MYPLTPLWSPLHSARRHRGVIPLSRDHRPRILAWISIVAGILAGRSSVNFTDGSSGNGHHTDGTLGHSQIGTGTFDKGSLGDGNLAEVIDAVLAHLRSEIAALRNVVAFARVLIDPGRGPASRSVGRVGLTC